MEDDNHTRDGLPLDLSLARATAESGDDLDTALIQTDRRMYGKKARNGG